MTHALLAAIAVGIGLVLGILLFVPLVAIAYRRRGRVTLRESLVAAAAIVYFVAIWVYTLLPLPDSADVRCASACAAGSSPPPSPVWRSRC